MSKKKTVTPFNFEGRFLGYVVKQGYKVKGLRLATASGEYAVKLPKPLRVTLSPTLMPGEWLQLAGQQTWDPKKGTLKLEADSVRLTAPVSQPVEQARSLGAAPVAQEGAIASVPQTRSVQAEKIFVCGKSDCCKRGGKAVTQALEQALSDRQLSDRVTIKATGCMKRCKAGPNLVMPDKTRYSRIRPEEIPTLVDRHFQPALSPTPNS